jgi:hypothetical protein
VLEKLYEEFELLRWDVDDKEQRRCDAISCPKDSLKKLCETRLNDVVPSQARLEPPRIGEIVSFRTALGQVYLKTKQKNQKQKRCDKPPAWYHSLAESHAMNC